MQPVPRATFEGAPQLGRLSARLAIGEDVPDDDVEQALGEGTVPVFRFAQARMAGRVRKTTREPSFCHSADVALRAVDLGFGPEVVKLGLLHDVVEDSTKGLEAPLRLLEQVGERFGDGLARDLRLVSNRYSLLLGEACRLLDPVPPIGPEAFGPVRDALGRLYEGLSPELQEAYRHEFHRLLYFFHDLDLAEGARMARLDHGYTLAKELSLHAYRPFVEELADDARDRGTPLYEQALVGKGLDLVDNLRTTEIAAFHPLQRIVHKAEVYLDKTFYLHAVARGRGAGGSFLVFYDYVKHHLVEQLEERSRALAFLSDSRFAYLVDFLLHAIGRVQAKYEVGPDPVGELSALRSEIRRRNGV